MSRASSCGTTSDEEMDTILQFAEQPISRDLFSKETEPTQTWLSGASQNASSRERDGNESCERFHAAHILVDIIDTTSKQFDHGNDPVKAQGRDKPKNVNDVEASQEGNDSNGLQRIESNTSVITLKCSTSSTSTDKTVGNGTSGGDVVGPNIKGPVVAKVRRQGDGGSSSSRTCSYFCKLTGIMKIIEIIAMLLALIITVGVDGAGYYSDSLIIVNGVMLMGLTVTPTLLVCYLLKQTHIQSTFFELIINGFLALYSVVAGWSALSPLMGSDSNVAVSVVLGLFLIIAGVAYAVDCVLAILKYRT